MVETSVFTCIEENSKICSEIVQDTHRTLFNSGDSFDFQLNKKILQRVRIENQIASLACKKYSSHTCDEKVFSSGSPQV